MVRREVGISPRFFFRVVCHVDHRGKEDTDIARGFGRIFFFFFVVRGNAITAENLGRSLQASQSIGDREWRKKKKNVGTYHGTYAFAASTRCTTV